MKHRVAERLAEYVAAEMDADDLLQLGDAADFGGGMQRDLGRKDGKPAESLVG